MILLTVWLLLALTSFAVRDSLRVLSIQMPLWIIPIGLLAIGVGTYFTVWASGTLGWRTLFAVPTLRPKGSVAKQTLLSTSGPYALVRHPLYFGEVLSLAGFVALSGALGSLFLLGSWITGAYVIIAIEEAELKDRFGGQYAKYASEVNWLFPINRRIS